MRLWIFYCLVAASAVTGRPADNKPDTVEVVNYENSRPGDGDEFYYAFEQTDGTKVVVESEKIKVVQDGKEVEVLKITGSYSYDVDGVTYKVKYEADHNGYRPKVSSGPSDKPPGSSICNPLILASCLG